MCMKDITNLKLNSQLAGYGNEDAKRVKSIATPTKKRDLYTFGGREMKRSVFGGDLSQNLSFSRIAKIFYKK